MSHPNSRPALTVTVITLNEERNLARALQSVQFAGEILVVDSGSTDRTREIAREHGARVLENPWPGYGQQKNFAQDHATHDWVLNIDADEEVPPALRDELLDALARPDAPDSPRGFLLPRKTWYLGRWILHGGWYPNHLVRLANRRFARWTEPPVHEEWKVNGAVRTLTHPLHHYTFRGIADQVRTNLRYSRLGYEQLLRKGRQASVGKMLWKPWGKFLETYFLKRGFMDGVPGLIISINAAHSLFLKYAYFFEKPENGETD